MQKRLVFMELGDYSDDGHGKTSTIALVVAGEDVSNERMKQAKQEAIEFSGVNIDTMFEEYEDREILIEDLRKLIECGFISLDKEEPRAVGEPFIFIDRTDHADLVKEGIIKDGDINEISPTYLLMKFLGYGISDFKYKIMNVDENDYIVGNGYGSKQKPINGFGYGLLS